MICKKVEEFIKYFREGIDINELFFENDEQYLELLERCSIFSPAYYDVLEVIKKDERFINVFNKTYEKIYNQAKEDDDYALFYLGKLNYYGIGIEENKELGIRLLEKASKLNSAEAMKLLFYVYITSDKEKALSYLKEASKLDDGEALYILGAEYFHGDVCEKDYDKARKLLEKAIKGGNYQAMHMLGLMYENGMGVDKDIDKAISLYEKISNGEAVLGNNALGDLYSKLEDYSKAYNCYKIAADLDDPTGLYNIGKLLVQEKIKLDDDSINEGIRHLMQSGDLGCDMAFLLLGSIYEEGKVVEKNIDKAIEYYDWAIRFVNTKAMVKMALKYLEGKDVEKDIEYALKLLNDAIEEFDIEAYYILGKMYLEGEIVKEDINKGIEYLYFAIDNGHVGSMYYLGRYIIEYENETFSTNDGIEFCEKAAELGSIDAQFYIGARYQEGEYIDKDLDKAIYFLEKASNYGNLEAKVLLSTIYLTEEEYFDNVKGATYLHDAAENGLAEAQYCFGIYLYEVSETVEHLLVSKHYIELALDQGYEDTDNLLSEIEEAIKKKKAE